MHCNDRALPRSVRATASFVLRSRDALREEQGSQRHSINRRPSATSHKPALSSLLEKWEVVEGRSKQASHKVYLRACVAHRLLPGLGVRRRRRAVSPRRAIGSLGSTAAFDIVDQLNMSCELAATTEGSNRRISKPRSRYQASGTPSTLEAGATTRLPSTSSLYRA